MQPVSRSHKQLASEGPHFPEWASSISVLCFTMDLPLLIHAVPLPWSHVAFGSPWNPSELDSSSAGSCECGARSKDTRALPEQAAGQTEQPLSPPAEPQLPGAPTPGQLTSFVKYVEILHFWEHCFTFKHEANSQKASLGRGHRGVNKQTTNFLSLFCSLFLYFLPLHTIS